MKYNTIFFDLDDTLIDTRKNGKQALIELYDYYNVKNHYASFDDFFDVYQKINLDLWDRYEHGQITKDELITERFKCTFKGILDLSDKQSKEVNNTFLNHTIEKKNTIEGMLDILDYLATKYPMYILSNGFKEVQDRKMKKIGIDKYFKKVILSDHVGKNKPHPKIFSHALSEAKASNSASIMIGDNLSTDIIGAKNSQIDQIWFNPDQRIDTNKIKPTYIITHLTEIKNIL